MISNSARHVPSRSKLEAQYFNLGTPPLPTRAPTPISPRALTQSRMARRTCGANGFAHGRLMRATSGHVQHAGFKEHCNVIASVTTEHLLQALALHDEKADQREIMSDCGVNADLKRALAAAVQFSSSILLPSRQQNCLQGMSSTSLASAKFKEAFEEPHTA